MKPLVTIQSGSVPQVLGARKVIRATAVQPLGKAPKRYAVGRECGTCGTKLSTYNPETSCYVHTLRNPRKPKTRIRGKKQ